MYIKSFGNGVWRRENKLEERLAVLLAYGNRRSALPDYSLLQPYSPPVC